MYSSTLEPKTSNTVSLVTLFFLNNWLKLIERRRIFKNIFEFSCYFKLFLAFLVFYKFFLFLFPLFLLFVCCDLVHVAMREVNFANKKIIFSLLPKRVKFRVEYPNELVVLKRLSHRILVKKRFYCCRSRKMWKMFELFCVIFR